MKYKTWRVHKRTRRTLSFSFLTSLSMNASSCGIVVFDFVVWISTRNCLHHISRNVNKIAVYQSTGFTCVGRRIVSCSCVVGVSGCCYCISWLVVIRKYISTPQGLSDVTLSLQTSELQYSELIVMNPGTVVVVGYFAILYILDLQLFDRQL